MAYLKAEAEKGVVEELLALARAGEVSLVVTARIREDVPRNPLAAEIARLPTLGVADGASVTRLGSWVLGRDMLGSDAFGEAQQEIVADLRISHRIGVTGTTYTRTCFRVVRHTSRGMRGSWTLAGPCTNASGFALQHPRSTWLHGDSRHRHDRRHEATGDCHSLVAVARSDIEA
jgi:hypothetical protein